MNLEELKTTPTKEIINYLIQAEERGDQSLTNIFAYELACRIYVPNSSETFEEMLDKFGYKNISREKENKLIF